MECHECGAAVSVDAKFCWSCGAPIQTLHSVTDPLRVALEKAIGFQYRIERLLGRGGMGAVYLAHELALDRDVAIKVLPPEHAGAAQLRDRFLREARTAARLNHPNIVPLYTFGEVHGLVFFVMGYVPGESLASRLTRGGPLASDEVRRLLAELADALAYAHRLGVIHRDVKPDNILIDADTGSPRLTDFGIAKASFTDARLTLEGQLIGTPAYMSPEQALGHTDIDARTDIYSLGIVGFQLVSGRLPFEAAAPVDALRQRLTTQPQRLRIVVPSVAEDLAVAIDRCLERDPSKRWPDAKSLRFALAPTDDEADDPLFVRNLRMGILMITLAAPTLLSSTVFAWFYPGMVRRLAASLAGIVAGFLLMTLVSTVLLLRQGFGLRATVQAALRQPRGWRLWYPKRFRRRGDVYDRLLAPISRVRLHFALLFGFMFGIYFPLLIGLAATQGLEAISGLQFVPMVLVVLAFIERRRTVKQIAAMLGTTPAEASKIISTPTWRTSVWQRDPAAKLIRREPGAPAGTLVQTPVTATATMESGDRPTVG